MKTKKKLYAIAPEGCEDYLTPNKEYEIIEILPFEVTSLYGRSFIFINDIGTKSICHEFKCPHLHRGDWKIIEKWIR